METGSQKFSIPIWKRWLTISIWGYVNPPYGNRDPFVSNPRMEKLKCIQYMLNVQAAFGHEEVQAFPISLGLNNKGGMDDVEFFEYLQKSIMKFYPDAAPILAGNVAFLDVVNSWFWRHVFVSSRHVGPTRPTCRRHHVMSGSFFFVVCLVVT